MMTVSLIHGGECGRNPRSSPHLISYPLRGGNTKQPPVLEISSSIPYFAVLYIVDVELCQAGFQTLTTQTQPRMTLQLTLCNWQSTGSGWCKATTPPVAALPLVCSVGVGDSSQHELLNAFIHTWIIDVWIVQSSAGDVVWGREGVRIAGWNDGLPRRGGALRV